MKKKTTIDLITKSEQASLYSISFEKIINKKIEEGSVSVEERELHGIDNITFEI